MVAEFVTEAKRGKVTGNSKARYLINLSIKMGKKFLVLFGISIFIFMITSAIIDMNKRSDSIEKNKYETVAKVYKFHSNRSFNTYYFEYFYDGKKYRNSEDIDYGNREESKDKFYKVNLSTKNPQYSAIFLDHEIVDTSEIRNAGFK